MECSKCSATVMCHLCLTHSVEKDERQDREHILRVVFPFGIYGRLDCSAKALGGGSSWGTLGSPGEQGIAKVLLWVCVFSRPSKAYMCTCLTTALQNQESNFTWVS